MQPNQQPVATPQEQTLLREPGLSPGGFTAVPNWLFTECPDLSLQAKWTFSLLLHYSWQDGQCFPGIETLAADMGASRFSVMRWIGELKDYGLLAVKQRGLGQTNVYSLLDWKARQPAPDVVPMQHQEVAPVQHPEVAPVQHQEVAPSQHVDVAPVPHNKDTVVTKTQNTKTQGPLAPPVDISTAVDNSARRARAREAPPTVSKSELDPLPGWVQQAIRAIQLKREEETISARARELWAEAVQRTLGHLGQDERDAYLTYLLSDDYIKSRSSVKAVADAVEEDYGTWKRMGRPKTKDEQGKKAPKLPAHVQWEHDHAYNPKTSPHSVDATSSPTEIEATLADLRKYEGEESAQRWLRSIGLAGRGA